MTWPMRGIEAYGEGADGVYAEPVVLGVRHDELAVGELQGEVGYTETK
jgi:hypothetical protein